MEKGILNNNTALNNADGVKIITMLYDGANNFIRIAKEKMQQGDTLGKELYIKKTSAIVEELSRSLNMEGGEIAQNLRRLYGFVIETLHKANTENDTQAIDHAEQVIGILRDAWNEMQKVDNQIDLSKIETQR